jgi:ribonucleoside-diphosphate reductase alpha chain
LQVIKRNGQTAPFDFSKVEKVIRFAIEDEAMLNEFMNDLQLNIKNNITTEEIQKTLIKLASEKTSVENTKWQFVAAKLLAYDLYKQASMNRGYKKKVFGYYGFPKFVKELVEQGLYGEYLTKNYTYGDLVELGNYIDPERDNLLTYAGIKLLSDKYLVKGYKHEILELPQERFMIVAMTLACVEKKEDRVEWAKKFYDVISNLEVLTATPTLLNSGRPRTQLSSCFILTADDDLWGIYDVDSNAAQLSKFSGGIGIYVGAIRSRNAMIQGRPGLSNGVIPWLKKYATTAKAVDQLGSRNGAIAVYLDAWHPDIFEFLEMTKPNGDERLRVLDLFPAMCVPDLFMKQVKERGKWWLIDPHEIYYKKGYKLQDFYGEEWEKRYLKLIQDDEIKKVETDAILVMRKFLESASETGKPFMFYRDTVNKTNPNSHCGMIYSSNLCTEIFQNMSPTIKVDDYIDKHGRLHHVKEIGDTVVCNLSSLNLGKINSDEDLERIIPIQLRMLDNVIDMNFYPIKEAEVTNKKYRAVGLGTMSYHEYLVNRNIKWESPEHIQEADRLFERIAYYTIKASKDLAKEKGAYLMFEGSKWQTGELFDERGYNTPEWLQLKQEVMTYGVRNGWQQAVAPTASISVIAGTTATTDPIYSKFFWEEKDGGMIPQVAPNLSSKNFFLYKEAHYIDQMWSIEAQGARQKHIDQGNSFNLYVTQDTTPRQLLEYYIRAWECGLKSVYYMRSKTLDVEDCVSCT